MRDIKQSGWSQSFLDEKKLGHLYRRLIAMRQEGQEQTQRLLEKMAKQKHGAAQKASSRKQQYEINERQYNYYKERLGKIDAALLRIVQGEYGYCLETGRPISPFRLMANPLVELCGDAQRRREKWGHLKEAA